MYNSYILAYLYDILSNTTNWHPHEMVKCVLTDHGGRMLQLSLIVHEASSTQNLLSLTAMLPLPALSSVRVKAGSFTARASPKPVLRRSWMQPPGCWCARVSAWQCGGCAMPCRAVLGCQALPRVCCSVSAHPGATGQFDCGYLSC